MIRIRKGEIYLSDLGDVKCADIGKVRPVLVFQNDMLNRMIEEGLYDDVVVVPLSSKQIQSDFTLKLQKRDRLDKESTLLCNAVKMIKTKRLLTDRGVLTSLREDEMRQVEKRLALLLDMRL